MTRILDLVKLKWSNIMEKVVDRRPIRIGASFPESCLATSSVQLFIKFHWKLSEKNPGGDTFFNHSLIH